MRTTFRGVALAAGLAFGVAGSARAQRPLGGFRVTFGGGLVSSLAEVAPTRPVGIGFEVQPEWRSRGGFGLGVGFRYVSYPGVPNHGSLYLEAKKIWNAPPIRPLVGLRAGVFSGGDQGGDDPFIGVVGGPVLGFEKPLSPSATLQVAATLLETVALFRGLQGMYALHVGVVVR
jgi:hypothetical protein